MLIGSQGPVPPIVLKSVYWALEDMEHTIRTKFNTKDCMLTINVNSKNYLGWITGSGTSHINKVCEWRVSFLKSIVIGSQGPVPPIVVKSVYRGLKHMERQIHNKFDI